ncbi:hypothetical protein PLEOSDRAFT_25102 [Pleurotus ostreatus PC15]|uniref:Amidohydrolase-related domain-containing protein n=1 Tax=Pleurotus ostreatus (strain PC15) TaxID=1137138 RepID=A0A067NU54_PLEO1|nr:hypothetical protein PLEOSDRAFT_25102 [Pleurotus ostreatus PC15]
MQLPRQSSNMAPPQQQFLYIYAGKMFDPISRTIQPKRLIKVNVCMGRIQEVTSFTEIEVAKSGVRVLDCRELTIVPGFVDVHVHFFLHPYCETSWEDQLTKESLVERTIRAANHAKSTLMAGFTTVRDLGTEGAGDADIALRKCIKQGLIPGPRYYCANRAIVSTGSYGSSSPIYINAADGVDECTKVTRRQIGAGADWIKVHYRVLSRLSVSSSTSLAKLSVPTFSTSEMEAIISTAHGVASPISNKPAIRVAAHATNYATVKTLLELGVDSIEHGTDIGETKVETIAHLFQESGATWVPTLAAYYTLAGGQSSRAGELDAWARGERTFRAALPYISGDRSACTPRIRVAVGGDTGVFAHGHNALEMRLMVQLGAHWRDVLNWATIGGWGCITGRDPERVEEDEPGLFQDADEGDDPPFGALRPGWAADIVGLAGDLEAAKDPVAEFVRMTHEETGIRLVVKAGTVHRWEGAEPITVQ